MRNLSDFLFSEGKGSTIIQPLIDSLALACRYVGGEKSIGVPASPDNLTVNIDFGQGQVSDRGTSRIIERAAGHIIEQWVIENLPNAMYDIEKNVWVKAIPTYNGPYDLMYYDKNNKSDNIKIEVKSFKDGQIKNVKYSSEDQKNDVDIYIFIDYSIKGKTIHFNSVKLNEKPDSFAEIKAKKNISAKLIRNAKDVKELDTDNVIGFTAASDEEFD